MYKWTILLMLIVHVAGILFFTTWLLNHVIENGRKHIVSSCILSLMVVILYVSFFYLIIIAIK